MRFILCYPHMNAQVSKLVLPLEDFIMKYIYIYSVHYCLQFIKETKEHTLVYEYNFII